MNALERFEDWLHRFFEGSLAGLLGAEIQPVDIAKRLSDHMEDRRTIGAGRVYVPNNYRVYLSPRTLAGFATYQAVLEDEMAGFLEARGDERGYGFIGRVRVTMLPDADLPPEQMRIESDLLDHRGIALGESGHTQAIPVAPAPPPTVAALTLVLGQRRYILQGTSPVTVGRALDNDVIVDDASVSRHHARVMPRGSHWLLEDLGSTHGCFVNGHRVSAGLLRPGDQVRLGSVIVRLEAEPDREDPQPT